MNIIIWDSEEELIQSTSSTVLFWRRYEESIFENKISIPRWVEENDEILRKRYLAWIYDLGNLRIPKKGCNLSDFLKVRPGLSLWWMSLFVEKSNFAKSPHINDAIKLMAFDYWASNKKLKNIKFISSNRELAECLRMWCVENGVIFIYKFEFGRNFLKTIKNRLVHLLPAVLVALAWLVRHLLTRWNLRGVGVADWNKSTANISFISYMLNFIPNSLEKGIFQSYYWGGLIDLIQDSNNKTRWIHIFVPSKLISNSKQAKKILLEFNKNSNGMQTHVSLDSFLSFISIFNIIHDWLIFGIKSLRLERILEDVRSDNLALWPLFANDWKDFSIGKTAISNSLHLNLFEVAFKCAIPQRVGVYLQENMDWEFAFLWAWKYGGHQEIIGYPHTTVRYWDLRYHFDSRIFCDQRAMSMPVPDWLAVHGNATKESLINGNYPCEKLVEVEALRYNYLIQKCTSKVNSINVSKTILVLGEFVLEDAVKQMNLLEQAVRHLTNEMFFILKPHPATPIASENYPSLNIEVSSKSIQELLINCDIAYTGSQTSAAVDAYYLNIPIISILDPNMLNLHPLRGKSGVHFVSSAIQLAHALDHLDRSFSMKNCDDKYFILDENMPRWRKILLN